ASSVACRRRLISSSEAPYRASASGCSLISLNSIPPARTAASSLLRCQSMPPSQTGHLVLYQTTRRGPVMISFLNGAFANTTPKWHGFALPRRGSHRICVQRAPFDVRGRSECRVRGSHPQTAVASWQLVPHRKNSGSRSAPHIRQSGKVVSLVKEGVEL